MWQEIKLSFFLFNTKTVTSGCIAGENFSTVGSVLNELECNKYKKIPKSAKMLLRHKSSFLMRALQPFVI